MLLLLSLQNSEPVTLKFYHWWSWQAPLVFVVLVAFAVGVAAGLLAGAVALGAAEAPVEPPAPRARCRTSRPAPHGASAGSARACGDAVDFAHGGPQDASALSPASLNPSAPSTRPLPARMDFELWWLLPIPAVFFALGWIAARIDIKHLLRESRALPLSYFRGLNFLLNEQPDKAIESFIEVVKVDPQTIELHFALGSLFRRQGEIDRAIRMHQNLLDRADLPADKRAGGDLRARAGFPRAGLLDRAEELFTQARRARRSSIASLGFLLSIYEQEKDWPKAIAVTRRMEAHRQAAVLQGDRALPLRARAGGAAARATTRRRAATSSRRSANTRPARARRMLLGDLACAAGRRTTRRSRRGSASRRRIRRSCRSSPSGSPTRTASTGRTAQGLRLLQVVPGAIPVARLLNTRVRADARAGRPGRRGRADQGRAARNPTLLGLDRLLEAQLLAAPAERRHDLELVKQLVGQHIKRLGMYKCEHCGFRAQAVLLALPGLRQMGDVLAAAHRNAGRVCMTPRLRIGHRECKDHMPMTSHRSPRVIVALDFANPMHALALADRLDPRACALKVGKEMFVVAGPEPVRWMIERGFRVFLDLKFHDIPNTVAQACAAATRLGVWMLNVHARGGARCSKRRAMPWPRPRRERGTPPPLLIAVTVLTSLADADLRDIGIDGTAARQALRLAQLTRRAGSTASSARRSKRRRCARRFGAGFMLVTPGIRPAGSAQATTRRASSRRRPRSPTAPTISSSAARSRRRPIRSRARPPSTPRWEYALEESR